MKFYEVLFSSIIKSKKSMRITLLIFALLICACSSEDNSVETNNSKNQILPIRDSRIDGNRPSYESYRYELWKLLVDTGLEFDFVGPYNDDDHFATYPDYKNREFDDDHAGVGGFQSENVLGTIDRIFDAAPDPDIILLGIGGNDLLDNDEVSGIIDNINEIIDQIQLSTEDVVIIIEQIAPGRSDIFTPLLEQRFADFNEAILGVAQDQTTTSTPVIVVNMSEGWNDSYMADQVHYNELGAVLVAERYFNAFQQFLEE